MKVKELKILQPKKYLLNTKQVGEAWELLNELDVSRIRKKLLRSWLNFLENPTIL